MNMQEFDTSDPDQSPKEYEGEGSQPCAYLKQVHSIPLRAYTS